MLTAAATGNLRRSADWKIRAVDVLAFRCDAVNYDVSLPTQPRAAVTSPSERLASRTDKQAPAPPEYAYSVSFCTSARA
ncbi:hypothetical protein HPB47_021952 [Ixodes persulcatus]|uniref:Uncharacterized protein n=1 Tax=Ixodes persulcatus TaxID=34615 RepID=A0AC60QDB2_IXOPE|nr:hypothetical protein HPB47_021952 [Ixodes persulcatus]